MSADALLELDATGQAEAVRRGDVTPLALVDAAIARVERLNPALNAVIIPLFDQARARARTPERLPDGPFHGVPFLVKDLMAMMAGAPYHMGLRALRALGVVGWSDSHVTDKLQAAGLVIIGRTNTPELGTLPTTEPEVYGPTRNPWNPAHSAGGSSGGSASAVAARMVAAAHGNDGGGSIRIPASACGLVGLKPSRGRISLGPDLGEALFGLVMEGVLTRTVRDTAALLDVLAGPMPGDPYGAPPPARPFAAELGRRSGRLRIGVMTTPPAGAGPVDPECVRAVEDAAQLLGELGHAVDASHPAALDDFEAAQHFSTFYAVGQASVQDAIGHAIGRSLGPEDVDPFNWLLAEMGRACSAPRFAATVEWSHRYRRRMAQWWVDGHDVLVTPTLMTPPAEIGFFTPSAENPLDVGIRAASYAAFTSPFNMTGQPGISLPLHWTAGGLPVGVQLVAPLGREDVLIRLAAEIEQARPWVRRRPAVCA